MTIEIHQPELEALIRRRMESGRFRSIEDVLMQALKSSPETEAEEQPSARQPKKNFAQFLMDSPLPGSELNLERVRDYPRQIEF